MGIKKILLLSCAICLSSHDSNAAGTGNPGPTIPVVVETGDITWISGQTPSEGAILSGADLDITGTFCAYSNTIADTSNDTVPSLKITATSSNGTDEYVMTGGGTGNSNMSYNITFTSGFTTTPSPDEAAQTGNLMFANPPTNTCTGGLADNITLTVTIPGADVATAESGVYSDILTLTATSPEIT